MSDSWLAAYYWNIRAIIAEQNDIFATDDSRWFISDVDDAVLGERIEARLPYRDSSILYANCNLQIETVVVEWRYVYVYNSPEGERILQYDNREHHPEIDTFPHHMYKGPKPSRKGKDTAYPTDIDHLTFENVLLKIRGEFFAP